jgi:hypothetical protein
MRSSRRSGRCRKELPEIPATEIAERIGWDRSVTVLKERVRIVGRRVDAIAEIILANLETVAQDPTNGAIVVIGNDQLRIRSLPILPRKR